MAEHTPGPWRYIRTGDYWQITPTGIEGKDNMDGNEADYHLIAAAPELLAACEEAYRVLAIVQGMVIINRDPGTQRCLDLLEEVMKKARGETTT